MLEQSSNGKFDKNHKKLEISTNTKVKLLQTTVFPAVLYGCTGKQIKGRLMIPWIVRRMNASATNQIMPKHSLEIGHNKRIKSFWTHNALVRFHGKRFDVRKDRLQWKIRKTVYKMISRNMRNPEDVLVQQLNYHTKQSAMEGHYLQGHDKQEMSQKIRGSKTQYFVLTQSNRITKGNL